MKNAEIKVGVKMNEMNNILTLNIKHKQIHKTNKQTKTK